MTTLPTGKSYYMKYPITTVKPPHYRINELRTLIHLLVHI